MRLDGLAWLFALLVLGIGLLIILYARYYLSARDNMERFYTLLLLFMIGMVTMFESNRQTYVRGEWTMEVQQT